MFKINL